MLTRLANVIYWAVSGLAVIVALFALQTAYEYPHSTDKYFFAGVAGPRLSRTPNCGCCRKAFSA
jgi:hypothetical protein